MRSDLMFKIANRESRMEDAMEFFGWPREVVEALFKDSKAYFENPWQRFYPNHVDAYYAAGFYIIRQLSYSQEDIFSSNVRSFLDQVDGPCLDYACGVGDYVMYLACLGIPVFAVEHPGLPTTFLEFRFKKYFGQQGPIIPVYPAGDLHKLPYVDYALLISAIDHIPDPVRFAEQLSCLVRKKIFATPCIDETYDRPTHIKEILKDVPAAFDFINQFNQRPEKQ